MLTVALLQHGCSLLDLNDKHTLQEVKESLSSKNIVSHELADVVVQYD